MDAGRAADRLTVRLSIGVPHLPWDILADRVLSCGRRILLFIVRTL